MLNVRQRALSDGCRYQSCSLCWRRKCHSRNLRLPKILTATVGLNAVKRHWQGDSRLC